MYTAERPFFFGRSLSEVQVAGWLLVVAVLQVAAYAQTQRDLETHLYQLARDLAAQRADSQAHLAEIRNTQARLADSMTVLASEMTKLRTVVETLPTLSIEVGKLRVALEARQIYPTSEIMTLQTYIDLSFKLLGLLAALGWGGNRAVRIVRNHRAKGGN